MQPLVAEPTTTIRRYSVVVEAGERRTAALQAWMEAADAVLMNRNAETEARLNEAKKALDQANKDYLSVTKQTFPRN